MAQHYTIVVFRSEGRRLLDRRRARLKSCSAHGETAEAAVTEIQVAIEAWLETAREHGHPVPEPRFRPHLDAAE